MKITFARLVALAAATFAVLLPQSLARDEGPAVAYYPQTENVEGDQPLYHTYELEITSPSNLPAGSNVTITPQLFVIRAPAGVSDAEALSHVSFSPATLNFSGPLQKRYTTVICDFPVGTVAGEYAFGIRTPGWGVSANDTWGFINAKVFPPRARDVPSIILNSPVDGSVYTWVFGSSPLAIPVQFNATAPVDTPITSVDADVSGSGVNLTNVSGLGTGAVDAGGVFRLAQGGVFTVTARATNDLGTSSDSAEFTVNVIGPPPTAAIAAPASGSTFTLITGQTLNVPFVFSGTSLFGGITQLTATLNGVPVSFTPAGLGTLLASGTANLPITTAGTYVLTVTATNEWGSGATSAQFTVKTNTPTPPPPVVTIQSPANGTVITRTAGTPPTAVPFAFTATIDAGWKIVSIGATLNGAAQTVTAAGLNTALATGTGTFSVSAPGTYTLVASGSSASSSAAASVTITVKEVAPPVSCRLQWLPPISLGKVVEGCSTVPIKFTLECCEPKPVQHDCAKKRRWWGNSYYSKCDRHGRERCNDRRCDDDRTCGGRQDRYDRCERHYRERCDDRRCRDDDAGNRCARHGHRSHCDDHDASSAQASSSTLLRLFFGLLAGNCYQGGGNTPAPSHDDCHECTPDHCGKPGHAHNWCTKRDTTVVISIYEIFSNGSTSQPVRYTYSAKSPNPPNYTINSADMYHLNFPTARGKHRYHIDVYRTPAGGTPQLIGTKEFTTK